MPERSAFGWIFRRGLGKRIAAIESEQFLCQGQALFAEAVGEQAVMSDAHEAFWQHMEEEAAEELGCLELHDALPAAVGIILPTEAHPFPVEGDKAVVGDGDAMGVAAEIAQHSSGPPKGGLTSTTQRSFFSRSMVALNTSGSRKADAGPRQSSSLLT